MCECEIESAELTIGNQCVVLNRNGDTLSDKLDYSL